MYIILSNHSDKDVHIRQYPSVLDELGYFPISSKAEQILHDAAKKSIALLGEKAAKDLLEHISSISGFSEGELLMNYDLLEKSLYNLLGKGAEVILHDLKRELLVQAVLIDANITVTEILNPRLGIGDILKRIHAFEVVEFVRNVPSHSHIAFLYTNDNYKKNIFAAFFDTKINSAVKGLFSFKKPDNDYPSGVENIILYEELLQKPREYEVVVRRAADWLAKLNSANKSQQNNDASPTRIACEDIMWFFRNGFAGYILRSEKSCGRYLQDNVSSLCGYDISNVSNGHIDRESINTLISAHGYVILDEPFSLYRATDLEDRL
jgi:hypothetical protein